MYRILLPVMCLCLSLLGSPAAQATESAAAASINRGYIQLAHAVYEDSLQAALQLQNSIAAMLANPSDETLARARQAWRDARVPYQQSEAFRFSNPPVDERDARMNSWPLDEGLIDYVSPDYFYELGNVAAQLNIIANPRIDLGAGVLDSTELTPELLASLNELGGSEANVATGYHAIEFLLWGQDLNGTSPGAGERPYSDFIQGDGCSNGHCARRGDYLRAAVQLLINDLQDMVRLWDASVPGGYAQQLLQAEPELIQAKILFSMGSLSLGELAGERMKVALEANSTEDEHDCFSDNTHWSHYYDALGIRNLYLGEYRRIDGSVLKTQSLAALAAARSPQAHQQLLADLDRSVAAIQKLVDAAEDPEQPMKFDQMIAEGNDRGKALIQASIGALVQQTDSIERLARELAIDPARAVQF